jgi:hypothetical protein
VVLGKGLVTTVVLVQASTCNAAADALGSYFASSNPVTPNGTGSRYFGTDERGTIFQDTALPLTNALLATAGTVQPVQ